MNFDIEISLPSRILLMGNDCDAQQSCATTIAVQPEFEIGCAIVDETEDDDRLHGISPDHPAGKFLADQKWCDAIWLHYNPFQGQKTIIADQSLSMLVRYAHQLLTAGQFDMDSIDKQRLIEAILSDFPHQAAWPILGQITGGVCHLDADNYHVDQCSWPEQFYWSYVICPNDSHSDKNNKTSGDMRHIYQDFIESWRQSQWGSVWSSINRFHDLNAQIGNVPESVHAQIIRIRQIPDVVAAKYCYNDGWSGIFLVHGQTDQVAIKKMLAPQQSIIDSEIDNQGLQLKFDVAE